MDLTGKIIAVLPASSGVSQRTGNSWMSQDYVIEVPGQYPRKCLFRVFGEILTPTSIRVVGSTIFAPIVSCLQ